MRGAGRGLALLWWLVLIAQVVLAGRVGWRLVGTAGGRRIGPVPAAGGPAGTRAGKIAVIVPVLNEERRLGPCLAGLARQGPEVSRIVVVDGGSTDGTAAVVREAAAREPRLRWVEAGAAAAGWNGKVHNLQRGWEEVQEGADWILTIDADVRPGPGLAMALVGFAEREGVAALSVATRQRLSGAVEGVIHPALLATLVYRFGIPGSATAAVAGVQANGQCMLVRREALAAVGGFGPLRGSLCEDVTLARRLAASGRRVGFYEAEGLVSAEMYGGWREAWRNWPRSLALRDGYSGVRGWVGLAEVALVQALPLPLVAAMALWGRAAGRSRVGPPLLRLNLLLLAVRLGVLAGMARAYEGRPWSYWLSPACDGPAAVGVWLAAVRRRHAWRGRAVVRGGSG